MKILSIPNKICKRYKAFRKHPLTKRNSLAALIRYFKFNATQFFFKGPRVYNWISGLKFYAEKGDAGLVANIYYKLFDYEESMFLLSRLQPGDLFIDVGANLGHFSMLAAGISKARVLAIEPIPSTFEKLERNIALNKLGHLVSCINKGLGEKQGTLRFLTDRTVMNRVALDRENNTLDVEVCTLDELLEGKEAVFLKIDVEGFELPVLKGATKTLSKASLKYLMLEFNNSGTKYGYSDGEVYEFVTNYGFRPIHYDVKENRSIFTSGYNTQKFNTLFLREEICE